MALKCRVSDAEYIERIRRFDVNRWIWATLGIGAGIVCIGTALRLVWVTTQVNLGIPDGFEAYTVGFEVGFTVGRFTATYMALGSVALLVGIGMGTSRRKNRLLVQYYDLLVADEMESIGKERDYGETASGG